VAKSTRKQALVEEEDEKETPAAGQEQTGTVTDED